MITENNIPKRARDCRDCHEYAGVWVGLVYGNKFCEHHPGGCDYVGPLQYSPSEWVLSVVGQRYMGPFGEHVYVCTGYDRRCGFWMRRESSGYVTNVSERAIGKTFHQIYSS